MEGIETYITINGFSMMSNANASNAATLFVMLKNWDQRKSPQLSAQSLVNQFNGMAYEAIPEARTIQMNWLRSIKKKIWKSYLKYI